MKTKVKRLTTPEALANILPKMPTTIVQWVVENISNPKVYVLAEFDNDNLLGYVIAIDSVAPPLSNYFTVLFCGMDTEKTFDELEIIAQKNGASQIVMIVSAMSDNLKSLGFEQISVNVGRLI